MWRWEHWKHYDMCILKQSSAAETFLQEERGVGSLEDRLIKFYVRIESGMEKAKNLRIKSRFKRWSESIICVFQGPDLSKYFGSCLQKNSHCAEEICGFLNVGCPCQRKGTEYHGELHHNSTESSRTWVKFIKYQIENYIHKDESKIMNKIMKKWECLRQGLAVDIEHQMIEALWILKKAYKMCQVLHFW